MTDAARAMFRGLISIGARSLGFIRHEFTVYELGLLQELEDAEWIVATRRKADVADHAQPPAFNERDVRLTERGKTWKEANEW